MIVVLLFTIIIALDGHELPQAEYSSMFHFGRGPKGLQKEYDFVVVGAGPAGSVVASRLSEDPNVTVLLVEAGPEDKGVRFAKVPLTHPLMYSTGFNWKYKAEYDESACRSMINNSCLCHSGRGLGGGTNLNAMMFSRGNKQDYDKWAELGNDGWSYEDVLPYFIKLEQLDVKELEDGKFRGTEGNVYVAYSPYRSLGGKVFVKAGKELGYPLIDYNKPFGEGFGYVQATIKGGKRFNSVSAYLKPVKHRNNLHIITKSLVTKIVVNPETKTAEGIELIYKSKKRVVTARKEVVLSAGGFGSPKLLMLSGIGPKEDLESLGIEVIKDASVGDNLQDHVGTMSLVFLSRHKNFDLIPYKHYDPRTITVFTEYFLKHTGPLSSTGGDSVGYFRTKYAEDERPDVELQYLGFGLDIDYGLFLRKNIGFRWNVYNEYFRPLEGKNTFTIGVMCSYPKSRGRVRLASRDPKDAPVITTHYNDTDMKVVAEGMKLALKIAETKAMKDYGVKAYKKPQPGCEDLEYGTDEYFECAVRQITVTYHEQSGTCKMGPDSDPTAVVDPRLRVRGISKLRVVDSSIMPILPGAHTMGPSYMIGEKGAAMIKEDNNMI